MRDRAVEIVDTESEEFERERDRGGERDRSRGLPPRSRDSSNTVPFLRASASANCRSAIPLLQLISACRGLCHEMSALPFQQIIRSIAGQLGLQLWIQQLLCP